MQNTPKNQNKTDSSVDHIPVLLEQVLKYLDPKLGESYLDLTAGYGGHAEVILGRTLNGPVVLVDRDINAINYLIGKFKNQKVEIKHNDFLQASQDLANANNGFDLILADLGVSSPHLNIVDRGFSILNDGPLDMRMNQSQSLTADNIINNYSQTNIAELFLRYGEEPKAYKIARAIVFYSK